MTARLFIAFAVAPSPSLLHEFEKIKGQFSHDKIVWVNPQQLHLTLKFIGETPLTRIVELKDAMNEAFDEEHTSKISLQSLGVFGSSYRPRVLWSHVLPENILYGWFNKLKTALEKRGFEYDSQNFVPHITLARIKSIQDKNRLRAVVDAYQGFTFTETMVQEIVLYQSILKPSGPEYIALFSKSLH